MSTKPTISIAIILAIGTAWAFNWQSSTAQDVAVTAEMTGDSVEILARGPVHEAFAEPVNLQGFDPLVIEVAPPEPVEELPPEQKPEGENVEWIPGYWAWDDDRASFLWVSGVWRDIPPGQRWVPGYWSEAAGGWYWTAGFWVSDAVEEIVYLPEPPETLEVGPQIEAPSEDHVWVPGTWRYQETRYAWQPGYWTVVHPGWVWVPARYIWCPSGYVFADGYWDYPIEERGVLFAPVYYHEPVYQHTNYYHTPTVVISTDILKVHLFARPRYSHYYFGDYYAPRYREIGIEPWLMFPRVHGCYDPLFHYYSWHHRRHGRGDWHRTLRDRYDFFARHEDYRPAHTYADLRRQRFDRVRTGDINIDNNIQNIVVQQNNLAVNINQYVENVERNVRIDGDRGDRGDRRGRMRFARLGDDERRRFVENARDIRGFQERRSQIERVERIGDRGDRNELGDRDGRGDRGQFARGDRGARRSLRLADIDNRQGARDGAERGDRRGARGRDRARIAADVPPTPEQAADRAAGRANGRTDPTQDATAGARPDNRRSRSFERPGRADVTQDQDAAQDAISGRGRARDRARGRDSLGQQDSLPGQDAVGNRLGQDDRARDEQRARDAVGRRGRGRDDGVGLGRVGRDGPQFPDARIPDANRDVTTQTPPDAPLPPGGTSVTDPSGAGTARNEALEALRRGRGTRGDRAPGREGFNSADPTNDTGGFPGARRRDRDAFDAERRIGPNADADRGNRQRSEELRRRQQASTQQQVEDAQRRAERTRRDTADLLNRELRGRRDENRPQTDAFRQRDLNRDARRSRGQFGEDATRRGAQSQQQEALRRQMEQFREAERRGRGNNQDQLQNERRVRGRQRDATTAAQPWNPQQVDRGRAGLDGSRGRGSERSAFGDAGRRDSDARRRALEAIQNQERQRPSLDFGQRGGQTRGFDSRPGMQRGREGRADNDSRRQFSPDARSAFRGRGGDGGGREEASQRTNRGRGAADASPSSNRDDGGRRSLSRQQDQSAPATGRAERRGRSGDEDSRGGRGGRRGRDRDDND